MAVKILRICDTCGKEYEVLRDYNHSRFATILVDYQCLDCRHQEIYAKRPSKAQGLLWSA